MKAYTLLPLLMLLTACERHAESDVGRYEVVAAGGKEHSANIDMFPAWRIDTKTGDLSFCTYSVIAGDNKTTEATDCSAPAKVSAHEK